LPVADQATSRARPVLTTATHFPIPKARPENVDENSRAIEADLETANELPWVSPPKHELPHAILLTGTTGFLGSHMLFDLLRRSDARVFCLVRAKDDQLATGRLAEELQRRDLPWSKELQRRN
jgi:hypothetical protein